jgi:hypothetical protein
MRSTLSLACLGVVLLAPGFSAAQAVLAPVEVSSADREAPPNDYLRVTFVRPGVAVTTLSRPGSLRAFTTATPLYRPPLKLADFPKYSGLENKNDDVLVAMRCRPQNPATVDAVLATWPNVFEAIQRDVPLSPDTCNAQPADTPTQMACFAKAFTDPPRKAVPTSLAYTFNYAGKLYDADHTALAQWLQRNYGIYPAFAGTGYSVKDSDSLGTQPMTSQQILMKLVSSEYILKNVSLADAGCRCISVAPYTDRSNDRLDPEFIAQAGGDGTCNVVERLAVHVTAVARRPQTKSEDGEPRARSARLHERAHRHVQRQCPQDRPVRRQLLVRTRRHHGA